MASRLPQAAGLIALAALLAAGCSRTPPAPEAGARVAPATYATPPAAARYWNSATIYFLLTDRFANGDPTNDGALGRKKDGARFRNFEGGDLKGLTEKVNAGYFDSLGVDAIWLTPFVEQVHGAVDEGTGKTYGYHGYWARDWTAVDPALGTKDDLRAFIEAAHAHRIRVLMDAVINHPGPVTPEDPSWGDAWMRTTPQCTYKDYATATDCTLVPTLPDVRTESDAPVELPEMLVAKWTAEGRLEAEKASLDAFFQRTGHPRAPRYYFIKWLTDWVREFGIDGYRIDTAKHFEEDVALELRHEADRALADWRAAHPGKALDSLPFYIVGEVYGYGLGAGRSYDFGDRKVDYFAHGYDALINFDFKWQARDSLGARYAAYAASLTSGPLQGVAVLNYVSSHDDGGPLDKDRTDPLGTGTKLLLAPGGAQIYYGDETARPLTIPGANGDANLRSPMNWNDLARGARAPVVLAHWRKLGMFRKAHPAVGAGAHRELQAAPLVFARTLDSDTVIVALDLEPGAKAIPVGGLFPDGTALVDAYTGTVTKVQGGKAVLTTPATLVLLATP